MNQRTIKILTGFVILTAFSMGIGLYTARYYGVEQDQKLEGLFWPNPKHLGQFNARDHHGKEFGLDNLRGKWSFLFFGYTHCPDVCPITLSIFKQLLDSLEQSDTGENVQALFVTVDPERDTLQRLTDYVGYFHPDIIGLGGSRQEVESLTRQLGVVSMIREASADGNYLVDHSASVFLLGPEGQLLSIFSAPHNPESILRRFDKIRAFINKLNG